MEYDDKKLKELTGFEICEFEPDHEPCEKCGEQNKQLYWRRTDYWVVEGEYFCKDCAYKDAETNQQLMTNNYYG